jgi:purine-nucleoside phosphorylase
LHDRLKLDEAVAFLSSKISQNPVAAVVLGSGLGDFADQITDSVVIAANAIPSYPVSTVPGHAGQLVFGRIRENGRVSVPLLVFRGRVHFYESGNLETPVFPVRVAKALGIGSMIATNAAGGINRDFAEGDLMVISDFINSTSLKPRSFNHEEDPQLFRAGRKPYLDEQLTHLVEDAAKDLRIKLQHGTYCWLKGPSYETRAEIEMLRRLGVDAVGMSTVPEIIMASELGIRIAAISLISNLAAGLSEGRLSHKDVAETARRVKQKFIGLLKETVLRIKE